VKVTSSQFLGDSQADSASAAGNESYIFAWKHVQYPERSKKV
jgi:hypothetical protein